MTEDALHPTNPNPDSSKLAAAFTKRFGANPEVRPEQRVYRWLVFGMFGVYILVAILIYLTEGITLKPDTWAIGLLLGAIVLGRIGPFLRDWIPFVLLVFGYEFLRGIAGELALDGRVDNIGDSARGDFPNVHLEDLMRFDQALFAGIEPIGTLHEWLFDQGNVHWYDVAQLVVYSLHFVIPALFAFGLWLYHKDRFWLFTLSFCFMTYSAFAFFLFYPAAPPWLAVNWGYIQLEDVQKQAMNALSGGSLDATAIWGGASPHPMAAMPSLHAGFPWLMLLFCFRYFRWWGLLILPYNVAIWFTVVYSNNHWVVDVLAGMAWATLAFVLTDMIWYSFTASRVSLPWRKPAPDG